MLLIAKGQGEIWSSGGDYESKYILGCDVMQSGSKLPSVRMNLLPDPSTVKMEAAGSSETSVTN
jgi:hypothetical protein